MGLGSNNMLLVQKYLETHTFGELAAEHGVYASFSKSGHKWSLNYDQIEAKESNPLAQQCRGLILACEDGLPVIATGTTGFATRDATVPGKTKILAYPMNRFFNYGQGCAAQVNWSDPNLAILEKMDGTLAIVYFDSFTNQWCMATRSVPEADLLMDNGLYTFRTLFEKAVQETTGLTFGKSTTPEDLTFYMNVNLTYCFELTTPYNRIVVEYPKCGITLLAVRDIHTLEELNPDTLSSHYSALPVPVVKAYTYNSVDELVNWVSSLNPMEHEGVVVRDSNFNRIKLKNAAYVAFNKLNDKLGSSERNLMEFILLEKDDDVAGFLPEEIVNNMNKIKSGLIIALQKHDEAFQKALAEATAQAPGDKKTFAILVTKDKTMWTAPFFAMWDGKASSMKEFIQKNRKDGTWGDSFLDRILDITKQHST